MITITVNPITCDMLPEVTITLTDNSILPSFLSFVVTSGYNINIFANT